MSGGQFEWYARQWEEIQVLQSMFPEKDAFYMESDQLLALQTLVETSLRDRILPPLQCVLRLHPINTLSEIPSLQITLQPTYPQTALQATIRSSYIPSNQIQEWNGVLHECSTELVGEESMWTVYQKAMDLLQEFDKQECFNSIQQIRMLSLSRQPAAIGRRAIYFHHIIANNKRQFVIQEALRLRLGGFSKIGWPGIVIIEGDESHCQEYVSRLQHLRWKQMVVRGEQVEEINESQSIDTLRKIPLAFREFPTDGMSELATACREADVEDLFLATMKIYGRSEDKT